MGNSGKFLLFIAGSIFIDLFGIWGSFNCKTSAKLTNYILFLLHFYFPHLSIYVYYFVLLCFVISIYSNRAELSHFFGHEVLPLEIKLVGAGNQIVAVAKVDCSPLSSAIGAKEFHGAELEGKTNSKKYIFFQISKIF